jgi:DNA-binding MarR family transcriptional regulator
MEAAPVRLEVKSGPPSVTVRRAVLRLAVRLRAERGEAQLPPSMTSVLGHLYRRGPLSAGELAAADRVQPQSLTRTLAGLQERGLVTRKPAESDRRRVLIGLTEAGMRRLEAEMRTRDRWLAAAMQDTLSDTEQELLRLAAPLLERLAEAEISL